MRVTTGHMSSMDLPSATRRCSPRSMASPERTTWATVNDTVTFITTPR